MNASVCYTRLVDCAILYLLICISWLCVYYMLLPPSWLSWFLEKAMLHDEFSHLQIYVSLQIRVFHGYVVSI